MMQMQMVNDDWSELRSVVDVRAVLVVEEHRRENTTRDGAGDICVDHPKK